MSLSLAATMTLVEELRERGEDFCLVTVIRTANATSAKAGAKAVVTGDGALHGFIGGGCVQGAAIRTALAAMQAERAPPDPGTAKGRRERRCRGAGAARLPLPERRHGRSVPRADAAAHRIVICGASPVAATLARLARAMGYETVVAAPRGRPGEDRRGRPAARGLRSIGASATAAGRGGGRDPGPARSRGADRRAAEPRRLCRHGRQPRQDRQAAGAAASDVPDARKRRLHGPAGLDIGAIDPEEIALSILGEIVQDRRRPQRATRPERLPNS